MGTVDGYVVLVIAIVLVVAVVVVKITEARGRDRSPKDPGKDTDTRDDHGQ